MGSEGNEMVTQVQNKQERQVKSETKEQPNEVHKVSLNDIAFESSTKEELPMNLWALEEAQFVADPPQHNNLQGNLLLPPFLNQEEGNPETTLEDFLVNAGVFCINPSITPCIQPSQVSGAQELELGHEVEEERIIGRRSITGKREANEAADVAAERRQIRKLKNRESAARSRARKQAYILDLEGERDRLKEENACLRRSERRFLKMFRENLHEETDEEATQNNIQRFNQILRRCRSCAW
ncbi:uncharacterized protein [Typha latifolia]|uniref:uncharacterized protein n=1 Tax=Typha latifolia TaxID=4733 RepID=UPI003C2FF5E9